MTDKRISQLPELMAPADDDYVPVVDNSETDAANKNKRLTLIRMKGYAVPTDAEIGDIAFSNPPTDLSTAEQTAVRTAIGAGTGSGGGGTTVAAHTPAAGDDELAGVDIGGTDYEIVDREGRDRLHAVEQRVHPIREVPQTWADISDTSAGWVVDDSLSPTLAGLSYAQAAVSGTAAQFVYVRIPVGSVQSNYRFQYTITGGAQAGDVHNRVLGTWSGEQAGSDSSWRYYRVGFYEGDGFSGGKLQVGGSDSFEWEGSLTQEAVADQLDAIGVTQQVDALKNVTRDLHLDGVTRLVKNTAAATAGVARVAVANSARQAIEAGTQNLNVRGVTFTATLANAHFGSTATSTDLPIIRLVQTEDRSDWRILFDTTAFLAGGWVPINVSNGTAGYDYYISSKVDRTKEIALYKSIEETTFHGELAAGIVDIDALTAAVAARLLPTLPAMGSRDGLEPRFNGDALQWQSAADAGASLLGSDAIEVSATDDRAVVHLRAPNVEDGFWGRFPDDQAAPPGVADTKRGVPVRLTEVRSNDERTSNEKYDLQYEKVGSQAGSEDGHPKAPGTFPVEYTVDKILGGFTDPSNYDATKPGWTWDQTNRVFAHNGVAATVANSGSNTNKFKLRFEVDVAHHVITSNERPTLDMDLIVDVPLKFGVDRTHRFTFQQPDHGQLRTLAWELDIQASQAPAVTDTMRLKMRSRTLLGDTQALLLIDKVRVHFILPDSATHPVQTYDLGTGVTTGATAGSGRFRLPPTVGSHTDSQTAASVAINGNGRLEAKADIAKLVLSYSATSVPDRSNTFYLMTRVPGLVPPYPLHEFDDSRATLDIYQTVDHVLEGQEFWVEAAKATTAAQAGTPDLVWDSTQHESDVKEQLIYPGLITVLTQAEYDTETNHNRINPYNIYYIVEDDS